MAAYVILDIQVTDPEGYEEYKRIGGGSAAPYGGKMIVRGGRTEVLEGEWSPHRVVVVEFPTFEQAQRWWESDEYRPARDILDRTARSSTILVEWM